MSPQEPPTPDSPPVAKLVILVGEAPEWQPELGTLLASEGYAAERVAEVDAVLPILARRAVRALFLAVRPFAASYILLLRRIRETSPGTALVVVTKTPTDPDLKGAFEAGATAFLSWPASSDALLQAIGPINPRSEGMSP